MAGTESEVGKSKICLVKGDLTKVETDAILNAVNSGLIGGDGVDGLIHRKGELEILEECKEIRATDWPNGLPNGKSVITTGGNLERRFEIHGWTCVAERLQRRIRTVDKILPQLIKISSL